jgi:two-component system response regulator
MVKVLLVEDNEKNRNMLSRRLIKRDYEVIMAVNGQEGFDMAGTVDPDIILLDMSLPVMDGWEVASKLKADDSTSGIPIIALTAHAMAEDREKAIAAGCDEYETKPVRLNELLEKMEALLSG